MFNRPYFIVAGALVGVAFLGALLVGRSSSVSADGQPVSQGDSFFSRFSTPRRQMVTVPQGTRLAVRRKNKR